MGGRLRNGIDSTSILVYSAPRLCFLKKMEATFSVTGFRERDEHRKIARGIREPSSSGGTYYRPSVFPRTWKGGGERGVCADCSG